jgi:hypothetical protein
MKGVYFMLIQGENGDIQANDSICGFLVITMDEGQVFVNRHCRICGKPLELTEAIDNEDYCRYCS